MRDFAMCSKWGYSYFRIWTGSQLRSGNQSPAWNLRTNHVRSSLMNNLEHGKVVYGNRFLIAFLRGIIVPTYLREEKYIWKLKCSGWWLSLDPLDGLTTLSKWVITVRSPGLYVKAIASLIFNTSSNGRRKYWLWAENWRFHSCSSKAWELAC